MSPHDAWVSAVDALIAKQDAAMRQLKASWRPGQQWQCRRLNSSNDWHDLPVGHQPGWFFDTEYRLKPSTR